MRPKAQQHAFMFPLAQLASAFATGVLLDLKFSVPLKTSILAAATSTVFLNAALFRRSTLLPAAPLISLAFLFVGMTLATLEKKTIAANRVKVLLERGELSTAQPVEVTGVLVREPEVAAERRYLHLGVERVRSKGTERDASGTVALLVIVSAKAAQEYNQLELRYGARVRVMIMLDRTDKFRNPGVSTFTEYLDRKGYDAAAFIKSPLLIERLDDDSVLVPLAWVYACRVRLQEEIDRRFSNETAGVLDAALLGNRYNLSHEAAERFKQGGTFHVLVISGLHITFLGGLIFFIVRRFTKNRLLQFLTSTAVVWGYSLAVGAESTVVRAALMFTVVLLAPLVSRRAVSLNALGGVALALLAWRPSDLLDPSFQLTFASVLAIVVLSWPLLEKMAKVGGWRPSRATPYPPTCAPWFRTLAECLFWSERKGKRELKLANYSYRLFKAPFAARLERMHMQSALRYVFGAMVVSASVQLVLLPFLVVYFHRLSLASLLLNITVSLLMAGVTLSAAAGLVIAQVSTVFAEPLFNAAEALNWLMIHSVDPFEQAGLASLRLPEYTGWAAGIYVLYYLSLAPLAVALFRWQPLGLPRLGRTYWMNRHWFLRLTGGLQLLTIACVIWHPGSVVAASGILRIDFLDVGQGDAALVTLPQGTTILIDGGGEPGPFKKSDTSDEYGVETFERETRSTGEAVVSEYLWWRGLDHIDYLVATHADADHIDGLNDVARNFEVRAALVGRSPVSDPEFSKFSKTLSSRAIPMQTVGAGDEIRIGDVILEVLWPLPSPSQQLRSGNNDSLVVRLTYKHRSILMTGDIEESAERSLLRGHTDLTSDVVKVAHHGSRTSSTPEFITATKARVALISVGQTSVFGHPHPTVVERWKAFGSRLLITGSSGTITVTTDGEDLKISSFVGNN